MAAAAVAADSLIEIGEDGLGIESGLPVVAHRIPENGREGELAGGAEDIGPARAMGWAEVMDFFAEGVLNGGIRRGELFAHAEWRLIEKPGMSEGVVADEVTGRVDAAGEVAAFADEASDQK